MASAASPDDRPAPLPDLLAWSFGDRIRKIRRSLTTDSQPAFAEKLGVGLKSYSAWEAGTNLPSAQKIVAVARRIELLTGVPAAWVLGVDEPVAPAERDIPIAPLLCKSYGNVIPLRRPA